MAGYTVGINSETKAFKQGIDSGIIAPLEDAQDELLKLGKSRGPEELERAMKDAQDETKKLERETKDTADAIEREYKRAYRESKSAADDGLGKMKSGAQEVTQEIGSNLGEAVSSIRGDMSDLGQVGQDTLGGLAATLAGAGPAGIVGAAALAAGAVGLGMVTAQLQEQEERQERIKEQAGEWASAYQDAAGRIVSASHVVSEVQAIATDPERYQQAKDNARDWGVETSTAMRAMAGDATALEVVQDSLNGKQREWNDILKETSTGSGASYDKSTMTAEQRALGDELRRGTEALQEQNDAMNLGAEIARNTAGALYNYATQVGEATGETDDLGNAIIKLPDGKEVVINADTKTAYEDLDAMEQRKISPKTVGVKFVVDDAEVRAWKSPQKVGYVNYKAAQTAWE